jgi:predicted RNase H-like nuclease
VFPAPPRDVLEAATYADARALSTERYGRSVSAQSYALRHRILEVDAVARKDEVTDRIYEIHPELAFAAMAGGPLPWSKKTWNGVMRRRGLLLDEGITIPDLLEGPAATVPPDDVVDAAAVAWSARRIAEGNGNRLPADGAGEAFGMAIWY